MKTSRFPDVSQTTAPTLHLMCGKIAAGKSTLARHLANAPATLLLCEDDWLARLYKDDIRSVADYVRCAARLRDAMGGHIEALLTAGLSVVLDFPANTRANRRWMRAIFENAGALHCLHLLDVPDAICKTRLRQRNSDGTHDFAASDAEFDLITSHFVLPVPEEGFTILVHAEA